MGWGVLAEEPGRFFVAGAACQPWKADVVFTPIAAGLFASFAEPDRVKIAWTLETEALEPAVTRFATETRAAATDAPARARFRRYWRFAPLRHRGDGGCSCRASGERPSAGGEPRRPADPTRVAIAVEMLAQMPVQILETDRLTLRRLTVDDAAFILRLVDSASWLRFIGDKGVKTLEDARNYIVKGPVESDSALGFGLYIDGAERAGDLIGMCGLIKREALEDVDLGFAYFPEFWRQGFGYEAATGVIAHARATLGLERLLAITSPDNVGSIGLLEKLGFGYLRMVRLAEESPEVRLFSRSLA